MSTPTDGQVVVIEDDPDLRRIEHDLLENAGYTVQEAPDGAAGLSLLAGAEESVVVLVDYRMPHMDGYEMLKAVTNDHAELQRHAYVLVTANRVFLPPDFKRLLALQHIPIVEKPFEVDELLERVEEACEQIT
jgi:CheY-like chemotaxis protein